MAVFEFGIETPVIYVDAAALRQRFFGALQLGLINGIAFVFRDDRTVIGPQQGRDARTGPALLAHSFGIFVRQLFPAALFRRQVGGAKGGLARDDDRVWPKAF